MKHKMFLTAAAVLVLLCLNLSPALCQTGVLEELDPNILWVADSSIGIIDGFAVHPNGNVFAYRNGAKGGLGEGKRELKVIEINGKTGKLIRELPKFSDKFDIESIDISDDGRYLATSYDGVIITDLTIGISKVVGLGNLVTFLPNSHKVAYRSLYDGGTIGSDSSIVILDLETEQRAYIRTEELIYKIAFSHDGRFFATGGSLYTGNSPSYTTLKLWDAQTNKLIKELEKMENTNYNFQNIEFSNNSKLLAFLPYNGKVYMFNTVSSSLFRKYDENIYPIKGIGKFCFINDSLITFSTLGPSTLIWNYEKDEKAYNVANYMSPRGLNYSNELYAIILGTTTHLYAYSLNSIMTSVQEDVNQTTIIAMYSKGTLTVKGIHSIGNQINIEIFDINGKIVHQLKSQANNSEIRVPLILPRGTFLLTITEGLNQYFSKFLVTE